MPAADECGSECARGSATRGWRGVHIPRRLRIGSKGVHVSPISTTAPGGDRGSTGGGARARGGAREQHHKIEGRPTLQSKFTQLGCRECTLDLHGKPRLRTWTYLNDTAAAGADEICLVDMVDWEVGAMILIASTGYSRKLLTGV